MVLKHIPKYRLLHLHLCRAFMSLCACAVHRCGSEADTVSSSITSPPYFLRQVSHCSGAHCVASCKPRKPSGSPCLYYCLHLGHRYTGTLSFHTGAEDLNSGLYACAASDLPTEPSPQHQSIASDHRKQKDKLCYQVSRDLQFPIKLCLEHWLNIELLKKLS